MNESAQGWGGIALALSFLRAARRYWLGVFPGVCVERRRRGARASRIPDPQLRRMAVQAQRKWGNVEGAAAFATMVGPRRRRRAAVRAMVCFQEAYNYLDMLAEQPSADPAANARSLHQALLVALDPGGPHRDPGGPHRDYYEHSPWSEDGGYLRELVDGCREALVSLPSYAAVAPAIRAAAERIVEFQSCNTGELRSDLEALERWARAATPPGSGLHWWETAAAGGSSLCVYALLALAAEPGVDRSPGSGVSGSPDSHLDGSPDPGLAVAAVEAAYFPWIGALHSLLDNLVDAGEDRATGQHSLIGRYASPEEAAARMAWLARSSLRALGPPLRRGRAHRLIVGAMASFYLSTREAATPAALPVARAVLGALDGAADLTMPVFRARLRARRLLLGVPGLPAKRGDGAELVDVTRAHA